MRYSYFNTFSPLSFPSRTCPLSLRTSSCNNSLFLFSTDRALSRPSLPLPNFVPLVGVPAMPWNSHEWSPVYEYNTWMVSRLIAKEYVLRIKDILHSSSLPWIPQHFHAFETIMAQNFLDPEVHALAVSLSLKQNICRGKKRVANRLSEGH